MKPIIATLWLRYYDFTSAKLKSVFPTRGNGWWDHGALEKEYCLHQVADETFEQLLRRMEVSFRLRYKRTLDKDYDCSYRNADTGEEYLRQYRNTGRWVVP